MINILKKKNYYLNNKKQNENQNQNILRLYQSNLAHQEMVKKAKGGFENLLDTIDFQYEQIEELNQKIILLLKEINLLEKQIVNLTISYKFKFKSIYIEINKERFKDLFKNNPYYQKLKLIFKFAKNFKYKNNIFFCIKNLFYFLIRLKYIIYFLNLLFLINITMK